MYRVFIEREANWKAIHRRVNGSCAVWQNEPCIGYRFVFNYEDKHKKGVVHTIATSKVKNVLYSTHGTVIVCTENSVYTFEEGN